MYSFLWNSTAMKKNYRCSVIRWVTHAYTHTHTHTINEAVTQTNLECNTNWIQLGYLNFQLFFFFSGHRQITHDELWQTYWYGLQVFPLHIRKTVNTYRQRITRIYTQYTAQPPWNVRYWRATEFKTLSTWIGWHCGQIEQECGGKCNRRNVIICS